ncbi:TorF family putative porin [Trichloromonas sp.]|uniref:TorF family putative porin n=1 Tax=Trichloromonas sp. TaxID=3069249 RepID=UPI003D8176EF
MKKLLIVLLTAAMVSVVSAPAAIAAIEVEGDAYVGFFDKYLWRGFDLSGSVGVVQGGVDLSHKGFTLSYWTNIQADDDKSDGFKSGEATETDIVLDYSFALGEKVSMSVGNIYYHLDGLADTNEAYVGVTLNTILEPTLTAYYDWDECTEDGLFFTAAVGHSFDLAEGLSLSLGGLISYNQESDYAVGYYDSNDDWQDYSDWHNYELSVGVDYAINDNFTVSPSFMYSAPISTEAKWAIDSETVGGVTVTFAF